MAVRLPGNNPEYTASAPPEGRRGRGAARGGPALASIAYGADTWSVPCINMQCPGKVQT